MTPTPSPHSSLQDHFRFGRSRRPRNANPYDASYTITPTQAQASHQQEPVSPHVDEGADDESSDGEVQILDGAGDERDSEVEDEDIDEEGDDDGEEEEGGIEEGAF